MSSDLSGAVQDAYVRIGGHQGERPTYNFGRDGIVVEIEMHVHGFTGAHGLDSIGVEEMERQRQQARLFFGECLGYGPCAIVGPGALVRHFIPPHERLAIAFRQCGEDSAGPERIPYIPNNPFHAAFLISRAYLARTWRAVIVRRQLQQPRVEMNLIPAAFQHRTAKIVVLLWRTALCGGSGREPRRSGRQAWIMEHNPYSESSHLIRSASFRHPLIGRHSAERSTGGRHAATAACLVRNVISA